MCYKLFILWIYSCSRHGSLLRTWVKVVRCRLLAGVGHDAVVGVWPACWGALGGEGPPLPSSDCGSGFNFLNAPSAPVIAHRTIRSIRKEPHVYISEGFKGPDQRLPVMSSNLNQQDACRAAKMAWKLFDSATDLVLRRDLTMFLKALISLNKMALERQF